MGSLLFSPSASLVVIFLFPFSASARGGGGRGRGGGGFDFGGVSSSGGGDNGNGLASFYLQPLDATIFAFAVIFAAVSLYQGYIAARNIRRRILKIPPSISLPEFSVGPIFPVCLIMFAIFQMTANILQAIYWGLTYNENTTNHPDFSYAYTVAMGAMGFLADNFLVAGILALLFRRETVLVNTSRTILDVKMVADAILVVILFALSMGHVGIEGAGQLSFQDVKVWHDLGLAYESFFFIAVVDVAVSSIVLFVRTRQLPFKENLIVICTAFIISPLFIIYAIYPLILDGLRSSRVANDDSDEKWQVATVVISSVIEAIIVQICLRFGMPVLPKKRKEEKGGKGETEHFHPVSDDKAYRNS